MKKNIFTIALLAASFGAFAQTGLNDLKNAAKDAEKSGKEAIETVAEEKKAEAETKVKEVVTEKEQEIKEAVAEKVNVDEATIENVTEAVKEKVEEKIEEKVEEKKEAKADDLDAIKEDPTQVAARKTQLAKEIEEQEAVKEAKKTSLLEKIVALKDKIAAAEAKLGLLEKAGISPEELLKKTSIIDSAKQKLAGLTSSFM